MLFPIIILGTCVLVLVSFKDSKHNQQGQIQIQGEPVNLTPHLTEFTSLIRRGHRPSQWLVSSAVSEAYSIGNWRLAKSISDSYPNEVAFRRHVEVEDKKEKDIHKSKQEQVNKPKDESPKKVEEKKPLLLDYNRISSPVSYIPDDDWRMFVDISKIEGPNFVNENSVGMFRQNKKKLQKLGLNPDEIKDPIDQYNAFETECVKLIEEGRNLINQSVAMPIQVDNEDVPITLSGLLTVMRHAGIDNTAKWLDSNEERKKFPHTTRAFKRSNGCF